MDLASRIKQIIEYKGISVRKFCRETGLSNGFLDRVKDIGVSKLNKILSTYNEINPLWLLNGEGDMLIPGVTDRLKEDQEKYNTSPGNEDDFIYVPVVVQYSEAGYLKGFDDPEYIETMPKLLIPKEFEKGNYMIFSIRGDSLNNGNDNALCHGDKVLGKELPKEFWSSKLQFNKYLFTLVTNEGITTKQITSHNVTTGDIVCHSWNDAPEHADFTINLFKDVKKLFYVKKIVEKQIRLE